MLRFGTTVISAVLTFVAMLSLIAGTHVAFTEGRPGAAVLGLVIATAVYSVSALVSGLGGTLRRLEAGVARLEESMREPTDEA